jgi:alpha-methylacyl-CoA racemase
MRPLEDVLVLDFSTLLPGPMATLLLAEAGAEVVKIEKPGSGDEMRSYAPCWGQDSINFGLLNRGKKSVTLNLKSPDDLAQARCLAAKADILVEQFRPGVMDRLGLGYEAVSKENPGVIYCSITGYGQVGPRSGVAGHDLNYIGDTGLLALSMGSRSQPVVPPALIADIAGGAYPAVINILLALECRRRSGVGQWLDIAMSDNLFPLMYWALGNGLAADQWPENGTDLVTGGSPRYRLYVTQDNRIVAAAPIEERFWRTFCDIVGLAVEHRDDTRDPQKTASEIAKIIVGQKADYWASRFGDADCCCSVVRTLREALANSHFVARDVFGYRIRNESGAVLPALPVPIASAFRSSREQLIAAPSLGGDTDHYCHPKT